jgi:hypothetical protein
MFADVSEDRTASFFMVQEYDKQEATSKLNLLFDPEDVGSTFLRNVGKCLRLYGVTSQKISHRSENTESSKLTVAYQFSFFRH